MCVCVPRAGAAFCGCRGARETLNTSPAAIWEGEQGVVVVVVVVVVPGPPPSPPHPAVGFAEGPSEPGGTGERLEGKPGRSLAQRDAARDIKNKEIFISVE